MDTALRHRRPMDVIDHSIEGSRYTCLAFGLRYKNAGVRPYSGSVGDCLANAMCESFFATVECELLDRHWFRTFLAAQRAVFEYIEVCNSQHRMYSALEIGLTHIP